MSELPPGELNLAKQLRGLLTPAAVVLYEQILVRPVKVPDDSPEQSELLERGLARRLSATGELYALPPEPALSRALHQANERWLAAAPDFDGVLDAIHTLGLRPLLPDTAHTVDDSVERQQTAESMLTAAQASVWGLQPYPEWIPDHELADPDAWSRNYEHAPSQVQYRFVYDEQLLTFTEFHQMALDEIAEGAEIRIANWPLPTYVLIVDAAIALYFPQRRGPGNVTTDTGHIGLLELAFEAAWDRSVPLHTDSGLSPEHLQIHTLVALGHNNRSIATRLKVHERTVRRRINDLLDHHGQTTRAGLIRIDQTPW
jgi:DNA-binding CsgD family transcriptional regulator